VLAMMLVVGESDADAGVEEARGKHWHVLQRQRAERLLVVLVDYFQKLARPGAPNARPAAAPPSACHVPSVETRKRGSGSWR
jgi:hypothetical protein